MIQLTDKELKSIINKTSELSQQECLLVIQRYIKDTTNKNVEIRINNSFMEIDLLKSAFGIAMEYYTKIYYNCLYNKEGVLILKIDK